MNSHYVPLHKSRKGKQFEIVTLYDGPLPLMQPCSINSEFDVTYATVSHPIGHRYDDAAPLVYHALQQFYGDQKVNIIGPEHITGGFRYIVLGARGKLVPDENLWEYADFEFEWFNINQPVRTLKMRAEVRTIAGINPPQNANNPSIYKIQIESRYQGAIRAFESTLRTKIQQTGVLQSSVDWVSVVRKCCPWVQSDYIGQP